MKKNNILTGALILSIGGVLAKIFSAVYRIGLTRILGGEGIGLYQLVFPFYSLCVVFATAGLPMAISKVIAKNKGSEKQILKKSIKFTTTLALILTFILVVCSGGLAKLQGDKSISLFYLILAPTIVIVSLSSVLRGYFQGRQNFAPSAVSNILEQFVKLVFGLTLCLVLIKINVFVAIVGAMASIVVSEIVSIVVLLICFKREKFVKVDEKIVETKEILRDVLPITISNIILPVAAFVDSLIVVNLLSMNFDRKTSIYLYGLESGAVNNLVSLPTIFSFAIASVILPNISNTRHMFNKNFKLNLSLKIILIISLPCAVCMLLFPNQLISLLYGTRLSAFGFNGNEIASSLLAISGLGVVFLSINQLFASSLQAIDKRIVTVKNLLIAVTIKFAIEIAFLPTQVGICALAISNTACYCVVATLNYFSIRENFKLNIGTDFFAKIILSNFVLLLVLLIMFNANLNAFLTLTALCVGGMFYLVSLWIFKIYTKKDLAMLKYRKTKKQKICAKIK